MLSPAFGFQVPCSMSLKKRSRNPRVWEAVHYFRNPSSSRLFMHMSTPLFGAKPPSDTRSVSQKGRREGIATCDTLGGSPAQITIVWLSERHDERRSTFYFPMTALRLLSIIIETGNDESETMGISPQLPTYLQQFHIFYILLCIPHFGSMRVIN